MEECVEDMWRLQTLVLDSIMAVMKRLLISLYSLIACGEGVFV